MITNRAGFIISMYDEYENVLKTIQTINSNYNNPIIIVVRSDDGKRKKEWKQIQQVTSNSIVLPNLASEYHRLVLPAYAVTRNFSVGFSLLYKTHQEVEYIVALLGDTLIYDPQPLHDIAKKMVRKRKYLSCCKAYGQYFHSPESTPERIVAGRFQGKDTTDFSAVLFVINGQIFQKTRCFTDIAVTNEYSSEQCLGDEILRYFSKKELLKKTILINSNDRYFCYAFTNGITYHAITGKPGR